MNLSKTLDQVADSLDQIDWKKIFSELSELWDFLWKIVIISIILTYFACKMGFRMIYKLNDLLSRNWVRMLRLEQNSTHAEAGQAPIPVITDEVSVPTPLAVEVEPQLPPATSEVVETPVIDEQDSGFNTKLRRTSYPRSLVLPIQLWKRQ